MLRFLSLLWLACAALLTLAAGGGAQGPIPKGGDPAPVSIRFRNDTNFTVLLQGTTKVKNGERRGQPIVIAPGKAGFDNMVPPGFRSLIIVDFNRPSRVLFKDVIQIPPGRDLALVLRTLPNTERVVLLPDQPQSGDR
ncbi:MAG: hypothetical protein NZO58_07335 [Gemmataceae bacterium]|nr:hypothetical protein [Gemmataceae bacterium]